jgi:hypothetical protein
MPLTKNGSSPQIAGMAMNETVAVSRGGTARAMRGIVLGLACWCALASAVSGQNPVAPTGPRALFNGKDLDGWEGNKEIWSMKDGVLTGTMPGGLKTEDRFLVWKGGELGDFQLEFSYKMTSSRPEMPAYFQLIFRADTSETPYHGAGINTQLLGFLKDLTYFGQVAEGPVTKPGMRGYLAEPGAPVILHDADVGKENEVSTKNMKRFAAYLHRGWNDFRLLTKGNHLQTWLNGRPLVDLTDLTKGVKLKGGLAFFIVQVSNASGTPDITGQFKDFRLTELSAPAKP